MVRVALALLALVSWAPSPSARAPKAAGDGVLRLHDARALGGSVALPDGGVVMPLRVDGGIEPGLADWLACSLGGKCRGRSLVVPVRDAKQHVVGTHEMSDAYIAEVRIGALDPDGDDELSLALKVQAAAIAKPSSESETEAIAKPRPADAKRKPWRDSDFDLAIEGLPCDRILAVEPLTWTRADPGVDEGAKAKAVVSDLKLHLDRSRLAAWQAAVGGEASRRGELVLGVGPRKCTVGLQHLRVKSVRTLKRGRRVVATVAVGSLNLHCS